MMKGCTHEVLWDAPSMSETPLSTALALDGLPELCLMTFAGTAISFFSKQNACDICLEKMLRQVLLRAGGISCPL